MQGITHGSDPGFKFYFSENRIFGGHETHNFNNKEIILDFLILFTLSLMPGIQNLKPVGWQRFIKCLYFVCTLSKHKLSGYH